MKVNYTARLSSPFGEFCLLFEKGQQLRTVTRNDAKALRDALIELYPLERPAPKVSYEICGKTNSVYEMRDCVVRDRTKLGEFRSAEDARIFAEAKETKV